MKEWQFNVLFFVGVGAAILLLIGPVFGLDVGKNPTALAGVGSILTYILTQKKTLTRHSDERRERRRTDSSENGDNGQEENEQ